MIKLTVYRAQQRLSALRGESGCEASLIQDRYQPEPAAATTATASLSARRPSSPLTIRRPSPTLAICFPLPPLPHAFGKCAHAACMAANGFVVCRGAARRRLLFISCRAPYLSAPLRLALHL